MAKFVLTEGAAADLERIVQDRELDAPSQIANALRAIDESYMENVPAFTTGYDSEMLKRLQDYSGKRIDEIALFYGHSLELRSYELEMHIGSSRMDLLKVVVMNEDSPVNPQIFRSNVTRLGSVFFHDGDYCFDVKVGKERYIIRAKDVDLIDQ